MCKKVDYSTGNCQICWPGYIIAGPTCIVALTNS